MREQTPLQFEYLYGLWNRWFECRVYPSSKGLTIFAVEVTDRKQTEQALHDAEERLRVALQNAPITVYSQDRDLNYTWIYNPALLDLQEMLGKCDRDFLSPEDAEPLIAIKQRVLETGIGSRQEIKITKNRTNYYDLTVEPLYDSKQTIVGVTCAAIDISELKQAEMDCRDSEERLRLAIEGSQIGTWDIDLITGKAIWSDLHFSMLGYEPTPSGEATEEMWKTRIYADDVEQVVQEWQQACQMHRLYHAEYRVVRADNQQIAWLAGLGDFTYSLSGEPVRSIGVLFDITERKQAELMLVEQKRVLELIATGHSLDECLSAICSSVSRLNPQTRACILLTDAHRQSFSCAIAPAFPPSFILGLQNAPINEREIGTCGTAIYRGEPVTCADIANDDRWSQEWRNLCLTHQVLACHSSPVLGIDGLPVGCLMLCFNEARQPSNWEYQLANFGTHVASLVFERDRSSLALRESEARFRSVVESNMIGIFFWDAGGYITDGNEMAVKMLGYSREELQSRQVKWQDIIPPEFREIDAEMQAQLLSRGICSPLEKTYIHKNGTQVPILIGSALLPGYSDRGVAYFIDITNLKQAEAALRQSEAISRIRAEELETLMELVPVGIWFAHDPNCHQVTANRAAYELMRAEPGTGATATPADADYPFKFKLQRHGQDVPPEDLSLQRAGRTGQETAEEIELVFEDGVVRHIYGRAIPLRNEIGNVRGVIGAYVDISDRKQVEAEREQLLVRERAARAAAERANRIKDEFLAIVSHELRSPLNPILGWSTLLLRNKLDQAQTNQALSTIARNARLQAELIEDLLDVSRILRGKLSLNVSPVDLKSTIQAALETVRLSAEAKSIQIQLSLESNVGLISGDSSRLQQVVWNLLSNAIKFTPPGGQVDIRLERLGTAAQITVCDTGKGIHPDFLPHVFDYFRQEDAATTRKFGGLGLGLAIVHHLVELHGGTVQVESPGEEMGTTFTVTLPMMTDSAQLSPESQPSESALDLTGIRVLVVDDDNDTREVVAFFLEQAGASVVCSASAAEALVALNRSQPDVLLSDIGMPEVDGYMLLRQVRALPPEQGGRIPAIALTAYAGEIDFQQAMMAGFQRHIAKPIEPQILIQAISQLVSAKGLDNAP